MIQFLNPIWLWALAGILLPIGIHLLSRKEGKVFLMGSTRFIAETRTSKFSSIRLNEILLLSLRCVMITLLVFYISGFSIKSAKPEKWLLVEPGLEEHERFSVLRDSLIDDGYQVRLFSNGFPFQTDSSGDLNYWALIQALEKKTLQDVVILSRQHVSNFAGERVSLPSNIRWINPPSMPGQDFVADDGIKGSTNNLFTAFENENPVLFSGSATKTVNIFYDSSFRHDKDVLVAVLESIQEMFGIPFDIRINPAELNPEGAWHFNLGVSSPKEVGNMITYDFTGDSPDFLARDNRLPASYVITRRLTPDRVVDEKFTLQLARVLLAEYDSRDTSYPDIRVMPDEMLWKSGATASTNNIILPEGTDTPWLLLVFVAVLILERYISKRRNQ